MPNKQFLGLGFTFSATDRGLEKKLLGIQSALSGISDSLKSINQDASAASSSLGSMSAPSKSKSKASSRVTKAPKDPMVNFLTELTTLNKSVVVGFNSITAMMKKGKHHQTTFQPKIVVKVPKQSQPKIVVNVPKQSQPKLAKVSHKPADPDDDYKRTNIMDSFHKLSEGAKKELTNIFGSVEKVLGKDVAAQYIKQADKMEIFLNKNGDISSRSLVSLVHLSNEFVRTSDSMGKFMKSFNILNKMFEAGKAYVTNLGSSVNHFLETIGVDFGKMIPEQFKALYKIFDAAVISPVKKGVSVLFGTLFGGLKKSQTEKSIQLLNESIGRGTRNQSVEAILSRIENNTKKETKMSLSDMLFGLLLAPIALVAGALIGFGEVVYKTVKFLSGFRVLETLPTVFSKVVNYFSEFKAVKGISGAITKAVESFKEIGVIKQFLRPFGMYSQMIQKVTGLFQRFKAFFEPVIAMGSKMKDFFEPLFKIGPKLEALFANKIFASVFKFGKFIGRLIAWPLMLYDIFSGFYKAYKEGGSLIEIGLKGIFYAIDNIFMNIPSALFDIGKSIFSSVSTFFHGMPEKLSTFINTAGDKIVEMFNWLIDKVKALFPSMDSVKSGFASIADGITNFFDPKKVFTNNVIPIDKNKPKQTNDIMNQQPNMVDDSLNKLMMMDQLKDQKTLDGLKFLNDATTKVTPLSETTDPSLDRKAKALNDMTAESMGTGKTMLDILRQQLAIAQATLDAQKDLIQAMGQNKTINAKKQFKGDSIGQNSKAQLNGSFEGAG